MVTPLATPSRCRFCASPVRVRPATVRRYNGATGQHYREPNPLAGRYDRGGATRMGALDPRGYFCTMECAVRYAVLAVRAAET